MSVSINQAPPMAEPLVYIWWAASPQLVRTVFEYKKKLENVSIAKALQLKATRRRAVPIRFNFVARACQVGTRSAYPLPSFPAYTLHYAVTVNFETVTLTFDLWPWTYVVDRLRHGQTVRNLSEIGQSAAELLRSEYLTLWPCTHITCSVML